MSFEEQIMSKDKYRSIFIAPNGDYRVYYPSNLLSNACSFENWGYSRISLSFSWGMFGHVTCLDQSRASEKI